MKNKIFSLILTLAGAFALTGCNAEPVVGPQGEQGIQGEQGEPGKDGVSIVSVDLTSSDGLTDIYTITYSDGTTSNFVVTNGKDGEQGIQGIPGQDGHTPVITISSDGYWEVDGVKTSTKAQGEKGEPGKDGVDGHTPEITIGDNGNWFIDGEDTGVSAIGNNAIYRVTLNSNGGILDDGTTLVYEVRNNGFIYNLPTPTREGYVFLGWYTGLEESDGLFTTTTPVCQNLTLYAHWEPIGEKYFTVTWVNYNGTILEKDEGVYVGSIPIYDGNTPIRNTDNYNSYEFIGWSPTISPVENDVVYIAQYREIPKQYTITINLGNYGSIENNTYMYEYGEMIYEPEVDKNNVPETLVISGWYLDSEFINKVNFPYQITSDISLYAKWEYATDISQYLTFVYDETYNGYDVRSYNDIEHLTNVKIPETYNDGVHGVKPVVGMLATFNKNSYIKVVVLPDSLKFIGDNAFNDSSVRIVECGDNIEFIGDFAFNNSLLEKIHISKSLKNIGSYAFYNTSLATFDACNTDLTSIDNNAFSYSAISIFNASKTNLTSIGNEVFFGSSINIFDATDSNLLSIGNSSFGLCEELIEVSLPPSLKELGDACFNRTSSLRYIDLSKTKITKIPLNTFSRSFLQFIDLPETVKTIESGSFQCRLQTFEFPTSLKFIWHDAFDFSSLQTDSVIIPLTIERIEYSAFTGGNITYYCEATSMPNGYSEDAFEDNPVYYYSEAEPEDLEGFYWHYVNDKPWKW